METKEMQALNAYAKEIEAMAIRITAIYEEMVAMQHKYVINDPWSKDTELLEDMTDKTGTNTDTLWEAVDAIAEVTM